MVVCLFVQLLLLLHVATGAWMGQTEQQLRQLLCFLDEVNSIIGNSSLQENVCMFGFL